MQISDEVIGQELQQIETDCFTVWLAWEISITALSKSGQITKFVFLFPFNAKFLSSNVHYLITLLPMLLNFLIC